MLKLFRRIRQKLLQQGKVKAYLLYALGEIVLIVIGILLALQLNNINEAKKDNRNQIDLLQQIHASLTLDLAEIKGNMKISQNAIHSLAFLIDHMAAGEPYADSLDRHFSRAFLHSFFVSNTGPYESLKSIGINAITNDALRNQIIDLYEGRYTEYRLVEGELIKFINDFKNQEAKKYFKSFTLFDGMQAHDYTALRQDAEFAYVVRTLYDIYKIFQDFGNLKSQREIQALSERITKEIDALHD